MRAVVARWWSVVSFGCSSFSVSGGLSQWLVLCVAGLMGDGMSSGSGNEKAGLASLRSSISSSVTNHDNGKVYALCHMPGE